MIKALKPAIMPMFLALVFILSGCKKESGDDLTQDDIIKKVVKEHDNLTSYRDNSTATMSYISATPYTVVKQSKLVYSGDGRFRWEYYVVGNANSLYVIHRDIIGNVKSWWDVTDELKTPASLGIALPSATGVSDMTAFIVPSLLLPEEFDNHNIFKTLTSLARGPDENIDGDECYLITGKNNAGDLCKIYVLKENYLIRRYSDTHKFETFDFERVIDFNPQMNISIPDAEFVFGAP